MNYCTKFLKKIHNRILSHADQVSYPYMVFGIFGVISYPVYYFIWAYVAPVGYESFWLRLLASLLCLPLIFENKWSKAAKQFLPYYWYITILYSLPFLFSFLLFKNNFSYGLVLNGMTVITLSILLLDIIPLVIVLILGVGLSYGLFRLLSPNESVAISSYVLITYISLLIFGGLFAHRKERVQNAKLNTMKSMGASIAHELRTPLSAMRFTVSAGKDYMPTLVDTYRLATEHQLPVKPIQPRHLQVLSGIFEGIQKEIDYSATIIDMILANVKQNTIATAEIKQLSMSDCVSEALERYPFSDGEQNLVHYNASCNFIFRGDQGLMVHVLFNLMKNSLYYIKKANKGEITLYCDTTSDANHNWLYFRDSGPGIPAEVVPKLFGRFFTTSRHGTGLGLAFCKMVLECFGGDIRCVSEQGVFTEFRMNFPKIKESG